MKINVAAKPIDQGKILLPVARAAIARELDRVYQCGTSAEWLQEPGACFVTLTQQGNLRGCIGSLEPHRALLHDVEANARAAAFSDPRFAPLSAAEYEQTDIEISLLSPMQRMTFLDEADALAQLCPGVDGIVFEYNHFRSTFLPQVWEQLPTPREFIAHLKVKARLPANFWASDVKLHRYTVSKFKEHEHKR
ncbi:MAG TPA: AmmeMemoRadiSam system protein A [Spongiibacteraceae bacterium]|nr:AmmeMemoRadiSam system protein A [Spongiibacteraceae bacterium]